MFEWPSLEKREGFARDPRFLKVKPLRDDALALLEMGSFAVGQDQVVTFNEEKLYEVYGLWVNDKGQLDAYFEKAGPIVTGKYGAVFALNLQPLESATSSYTPEIFGVVEWNDKATNSRFFSPPEYNAIAHLKKAGLAKMDAWHTALQ